MNTLRFSQWIQNSGLHNSGGLAAGIYRRTRVGVGVFIYLMLGMSPAMADDLDIYTRNIGTAAGAPVIILQIDNSGSMRQNDTDDSTAVNFIRRRQYLVQDAARGQVTGLKGSFKVGVFDYVSDDYGQKLIDAKPLNDVVSSTSTTSGTTVYTISDGSDDVAQATSEPVRFADGTLAMSTYDRSPTTTPVSIPANGAWTSSGGQVSDSTATASGNRVYWYRHGSNSTTSQTITLDSTSLPTVDTYLYFQDAMGNPIASNDDRSPDSYSCNNSNYPTLQMTVPAGEPTTPAAPRCARTCSNRDATRSLFGCGTTPPAVPAGSKVYAAATYNAGNLNSTLNVTGLVNGTYYRIVVATYTPGQSGNYRLNFSNPTRGTLEVEAVGPSSVEQRVGLLFRGMEIPKGATISNAYLEFQSASANAAATSLAVGVDKSVAPDDFLTADLYATSRDIQWGPFATVANWTLGQLNAGTRISVTGLVDAQVNQTGWCGGDMAFVIKGPGDLIAKRIAHSLESTTGQAPRLVVTWSSAAASDCYRKSLTLDIKSMSEDVSEAASGAMAFTGASLPISVNQKVGLRFPLIPLPGGVTVESATLELNSFATTTARAIHIDAIDQPIAKPFGGSNGALSELPLVGNTITWTPPGWVAGSRYTSPNLKAMIQPLLDNLDWEYDGTIGLVLSGTNVSAMAMRAWERHQSGDTSYSLNKSEYGQFSARLRLTVSSTTPIPVQVTHRHQVADIVDAIPATTNTPIAGTFLEVAQYLLGKDGYTMPALAEGDCATNAVIFLTDGEETGDYSTYTPGGTFPNAAKAITGKTCSASSVYTCLYQLQDALYDGTTLAANGRKYSIRSYGVGFGPVATATTGALPETGNHGGGKYYGANNAGALANVFREITGQQIEGGATVAAPGVAVNALNRFEHLDELYYSLFKPATRVAWRGNVKRYRLYNSVIKDVAGADAVDAGTARFAATAQSWWSNMIDGSVVASGGAAGEMLNPDTRRLYTYMGGNPAGTAVNLESGPGAQPVNKANAALTPIVMGVDRLDDYATMTGVQLNAARDAAITFLRGGTNALPLLAFGSAVHASPLLVNYGMEDGRGAVNTLFVGDNDGVLHMIDTGEPSKPTITENLANGGGNELFAFVPQELLANAALLNANTRPVTGTGGGYIYGLDGTWTVRKDDVNHNSIIEAGDKVYLYGGMRRGGRNYYALDVTNVRRGGAAGQVPALKWVVQGGTAGAFANMGQSWSAPMVRTINLGGEHIRVVIFSGGYDAAAHDSVPALGAAGQLGRQVYMVNADTGALVWWASSEATANTVVPDMKYSITAAPVTIDRNGNGLTDGMYVVDLAGQVFRFDFDEGAAGASTFVRGNAARVVAKLGATAVGADITRDNRRFYDSPAVAFKESADGGDLLIAVTSGYREFPTNTATQEKVFLVIDRGARKMQPPTIATITVADLAVMPSTGELATAELAKPGWQMDLDSVVGEKGAGSPIIFNFTLFFSTYVPEGTATADCAPNIGFSRLYAMNLLTGGGMLQAGVTVSSNKRFIETAPGLAASPQMLMSGGQLIILSGTFAANTANLLVPSFTDSNLRVQQNINRSMWYEVR